ncbi:MAG: peptidoglycan DD-metalloendopeptidase family protein [Woeseiaceae bacterium]|nr:peptidoglycan DD-metalloendopeptidase family protein [Woeseiaceae bacterium]
MQVTDPAPIIETDGRAIVLDLSTGSKLCGEPVAGLDVHRFGELIDETLAAANTGFGFGRYAEPRELYTSEQFAEGAEPRTVHMGIDLFCRAGTPLCAPLDGRVELVANNAKELDYGPMLVLRHAAAGKPFYSLYGHLGPEVLDAMAPGQLIRAGQRIATVGAPPGNGNWPPHLHFQVIRDLVNLGADFPGVSSEKDKDYWLGLSPSPAAFFPEYDAEMLEYS